MWGTVEGLSIVNPCSAVVSMGEAAVFQQHFVDQQLASATIGSFFASFFVQMVECYLRPRKGKFFLKLLMLEFYA